jgi:hypothetical protein
MNTESEDQDNDMTWNVLGHSFKNGRGLVHLMINECVDELEGFYM